MDYRIIFYNAHKTGACENSIIEALAPFGFVLSASNAAADAQILGNFTAGGFCKSNFIITVSGFSNAKESAESIFSSAIDPQKTVECKKIGNHRAYLLTCDNQALLMLPDEPSEITQIFKQGALSELRNFFKS